MGLLQSIFSSVSAVFQASKRAVEDAVIGTAVHFRESAFGRELETVVKKATDAVRRGAKWAWNEIDDAFKKGSVGAAKVVEKAGQAVSEAYRAAATVFEEEQEFQDKRRQDGRLTETDQERLHELYDERQRLKQEISDLKAGVAAVKLQAESVIATILSSDELSANTGILATMECPQCGGVMRIRQGALDADKKAYKFWWQCASNLNGFPCRTVKIDLRTSVLNVVRPPNPDLDGDRARRDRIWNRPDVVQQTLNRVRPMVGELDEDLMCPIHAMPMMLAFKKYPGGRLLDSFEYVCSSNSAGLCHCDYVVPLAMFPQVASLLRRKTTRGIIDGIVEF